MRAPHATRNRRGAITLTTSAAAATCAPAEVLAAYGDGVGDGPDEGCVAVERPAAGGTAIAPTGEVTFVPLEERKPETSAPNPTPVQGSRPHTSAAGPKSPYLRHRAPTRFVRARLRRPLRPRLGRHRRPLQRRHRLRLRFRHRPLVRTLDPTIGAGARRDESWTVCVEEWRVPWGMRVEARGPRGGVGVGGRCQGRPVQ